VKFDLQKYAIDQLRPLPLIQELGLWKIGIFQKTYQAGITFCRIISTIVPNVQTLTLNFSSMVKISGI